MNDGIFTSAKFVAGDYTFFRRVKFIENLNALISIVFPPKLESAEKIFEQEGIPKKHI